jgi:DNA-binding Lrp family transcriptional regulator
MIRRYQRDLNIEEQRARDIQDFLSNNARIQQLQRLLNQNESTQRANEIEDVRVREINRNKLKNMYEELKFLNSGEYIMEQQPGETEQEFQQRLMNIGATTVNESSIEKNAIMQNIETAKKNLRELTSSEGKISTVIKMLEPPEMRYAFNKRFPAIKKKFIETYGANNANVSDKDIYDFIESELQGKYERVAVGQLIDLLPEEAPKEVRELSAPFIQKAPKVRESTETKQANAELRRQELKLERERKINEAQAKGALSRRLASEEKRREEIDFPIFSQYATAQPVQALPQLPDYYTLPAAAEEVNPLTISSLERKLESFKEPTQRVSSKQVLIDYLRVAFPGLQVSKRAQIGNLTDAQRASTSTEKILTKLADQDPATFYTLPPEIYAQFSPNDKAVYNRIKKEVDEGTFKGTGIKVDYNHNQYPLKFQLGKIIYEPQRLFEHNILSLKSLKGQSMPGLKNVRVSDALSNILVRMSANNMPNKGDLSVLNDSEREMYDNIIAMSGLKKTTINTFEDTVPKMKKRLGLIEGEIEAGNTNRALLDEARTIIYNMARSKLISRGAADNHIKQLRQYFR